MCHRVSVITICFNNLEELKATCASVDIQTITPYEHWVIDGSTDSVIKEYLGSGLHPAYRKWISEPDNGISDAFNKGISLATGDILNMLNSGDCYLDDLVLLRVKQAFDKNPSLEWLHSKYRICRSNIWITIGKPFDKNKLYRGMRSLAHQSMFLRRGLHEKHGLYDTSLSIAMDYDFVCRISNEAFTFIRNPLIVFAPGGISQNNYLQSLKETRNVYERYYGFSLKLLVWQIRLKTLYYVLKSSPGKLIYKLKVKLKLGNL